MQTALLCMLVVALAAVAITLASLSYAASRGPKRYAITGQHLQSAIARSRGEHVLHKTKEAVDPNRYVGKVTIFHPYYNNAETLKVLLSRYWEAPDEDKARVVLMIVDDASPDTPAEPVVREFLEEHPEGAPFEVRVVTLKEDIGFNVAGARNTGVEAAPTKVVAYGDIDFAPASGRLAELLQAAPALEGDNYLMYAVEHERGWYTTMWMVNKHAYNLVGGYDEGYSGHYGAEESDFHERATRSAMVKTSTHPYYTITEDELEANRASDHCSSCDQLEDGGARQKQVDEANAAWGVKRKQGPHRPIGATVRVPWVATRLT